MIVLRVLIADDSEDDAMLIAYKVQRAGYTIEWHRVELESDFANALPRADLVICDYAMPAFSPERALAQIKASGRTTPLLLVSGVVGGEAAYRLVRAGAVGCVMKDKLDRLGPAIASALAAAT